VALVAKRSAAILRAVAEAEDSQCLAGRNVAAGLFGRAGVMNVAYNGEPDFPAMKQGVRGTQELQSEKVSETGSWRNREIRNPKPEEKSEGRNSKNPTVCDLVRISGSDFRRLEFRTRSN